MSKSKIVIDFASALYLKHNLRRVLVITVTSGLGVWADEVARHCPHPWIVFDWHGEVQARSSKSPKDDRLQFVVVNFQNVYDRVNTGGRSWSVVERQLLLKFNPELVVVDESHHIGNPGTEAFKHAHRLGKRARFRVIMTGTMFHRKPFYTFGQINFLDNGRSFGGSWTNFKKQVAVFGGRTGYEILRYKRLGWMMKEVKKQVLIEKPKKLAQPVENVLHFELTGKGLAAYNEMDKHKILQTRGETVASPLIITKHLRLAMIESGWIKLDSGKFVKVGDDKIRLAEDRLNEYMEQEIEKAVVACRFLPELADVARAAKKLGFKPILFHGGIKPGKPRTARIREFDRYKGPALFISQVATGSQAIDLSVADTTMWYGLPESYLIFDQFKSRTAKFEEKRTLQHDFLIARRRRGEVTHAALQMKRDVAELLASNPRLVEKLTRVADE